MRRIRCLKKFFNKTTFLSVILFLNFFIGPTTVPTVFSQTKSKTFSISFKDKKLSYMLDYISRNSKYEIVLDKDVKTYSPKFTVSFDRVDAVNAVKKLLAKTPFTHNIKGSRINVFRLQEAQAGQYKVTGVIKDNKGITIPGATIQEKNTAYGVVADINGSFSITVSRPKGELIISSMGFETQNVKYTAGEPLTIKMKEKINEIGEVSVIAYGKKNTRELVGSISSVKLKQLENTPTPSIENLLQGQMSGVAVSNLSGTPGGGGSQVIIRGYNSLNIDGVNDSSPLYVIDGVPVKSTTSVNTGGINTLAGLDPSSIASVEVLKDAASAALYGSRAGNGVILITTKKGKKGKVQFRANVSQSLSFLPATPKQLIGVGERRLHTMLAKNQRIAHYDWVTQKFKIAKNYKDTWGWGSMYDGAYDFFWKNGNIVGGDFGTPDIVQDSLNPFYNNATNWWDYMFRTGRVTNANVQVSGGNENTRYLINGGIYDEKGIMLNSSFLRASTLINLDLNLTPKLEAFVRTNLAYTDKSAGDDMGKAQGLTVDPKSTSSLLPGKGSIAEKEAVKRLRDIDRKNFNYNIRLNAGLKYKILKGLNFSSTAAIDHYFTRSYTFTPDYLSWENFSEVRAANIAMTMLQSENLLSYKFDLNDNHHFNLLAGITYNKETLNILRGSAKKGPTNQIKQVGEGWPSLIKDEWGTVRALQEFRTDKQEQSMVSFLGRLTYNYKGKYLLEASARRDGSSVFLDDVRWGVFPAAAIGWTFSKEPFMKDLWWLNFGKIRASWGRSGQKFQDAYLAHGIMQESNTFLGNLGLAPGLMANNKLTWEKNDQYDIGLDLDLFNYALKLKFDYYYKYSHALLMQTPTPGNFFLANKVWNNASAISNEGIEFEALVKIISKDDFNWSDKVLGRPVYGIYTYKDEGIVQKDSELPYYYNQLGIRTPLSFQSNDYPLRVGGRKIKDQNMDGIINDQDIYYAGSTIPTAYGGISNEIKWKNFTVFSFHL